KTYLSLFISIRYIDSELWKREPLVSHSTNSQVPLTSVGSSRWRSGLGNGAGANASEDAAITSRATARHVFIGVLQPGWRGGHFFLRLNTIVASAESKSLGRPPPGCEVPMVSTSFSSL